MTNPLRVGVIGLGPLWHKRYKSALLALPQRFQVTSLCDQVAQHAAQEAKRLSCAATGPTELLESPEVEAVLLLDPQWYRLWPLQTACHLGKPVFTCTSLDQGDANADAVWEQVRASSLPVLLELAPRAAPVLGRLRDLLDTRLGPPRLVVVEASEAQTGARRGSANRRGFPDPAALPEPGLGAETAILDCCSLLLPGEPLTVRAADLAGGALSSWLLDWGADRAAQVTRYRAALPRSGLRLHVVAERGTATAEFPNRLHWTEADGSHTHVAHLERPLGQVLLEQFYQVAREGRNPEPGPEEIGRFRDWVRSAAQSRAEGRTIPLGIRD
jgi:predicted dehydrogenase